MPGPKKRSKKLPPNPSGDIRKVPIFKSSKEAKDFMLSLSPGDAVTSSVIDPDTGEVYMEPGDLAPDPHKRPFAAKYIHVFGWNAYDYVYDFERKYDVRKEELSAGLDEPEFVAAGDYDIGTVVPVSVKRPDGAPMTNDDIENAEEYVEWLNGSSPFGNPVADVDRLIPPNMELMCHGREGDLALDISVVLK